MLEGAGLLLDQTYRMHPDLCRYTSEVFYDGKLHGAGDLAQIEPSVRAAAHECVLVPDGGTP